MPFASHVALADSFVIKIFTRVGGIAMAQRSSPIGKHHCTHTHLLIPTFFLTLPPSVREEMFGINLFGLTNSPICVLYFVEFKRTVKLWPSLLRPGLTMPTVQVTVHPIRQEAITWIFKEFEAVRRLLGSLKSLKPLRWI